jgi:hypothetical protein
MQKILLIYTFIILSWLSLSYADNGHTQQTWYFEKKLDIVGDFYKSANSQFFVLLNNNTVDEGGTGIPSFAVFNAQGDRLSSTTLTEGGFVTSVSLSNTGLVLINQQDFGVEFGRKALLYNSLGHQQWVYKYISEGAEMMLSPSGSYIVKSADAKPPEVLSTQQWDPLPLTTLPLMDFSVAMFNSQDQLIVLAGSRNPQMLLIDIAQDSIVRAVSIAGESGEEVRVAGHESFDRYFSFSPGYQTFACKLIYPLKDCGWACPEHGVVVFNEHLDIILNKKYPGEIPYMKLLTNDSLLLTLLEHIGGHTEKARVTSPINILLTDIDSQKILLKKETESLFLRYPSLRDKQLYFLERVTDDTAKASRTGGHREQWSVTKYDLNTTVVSEDAASTIPLGSTNNILLMKDIGTNTVDLFRAR